MSDKITYYTSEAAWLRFHSAYELGRCWAKDRKFRNELEALVHWYSSITYDEWERLFTSGEEQFKKTALDVFYIISPVEQSPELAWECWHSWLNVDSDHEITPDQLKAFLDGALVAWAFGKLGIE